MHVSSWSRIGCRHLFFFFFFFYFIFRLFRSFHSACSMKRKPNSKNNVFFLSVCWFLRVIIITIFLLFIFE